MEVVRVPALLPSAVTVGLWQNSRSLYYIKYYITTIQSIVVNTYHDYKTHTLLMKHVPWLWNCTFLETCLVLLPSLFSRKHQIYRNYWTKESWLCSLSLSLAFLTSSPPPILYLVFLQQETVDCLHHGCHDYHNTWYEHASPAPLLVLPQTLPLQIAPVT